MNSSRRRRNPFLRRRHHRRNPSGMAGFNTKSLLYLALGAGAGVIGSKYLTQAVLGSNNSGVVGYGGQTVATLLLGWLANKFVGREAAIGVVAGGLGAVTLRAFQEQVSQTAVAPVAAPMSGLGDPDMAALGVGMGDFVNGSWSVPARFQPALAAAAAAGVGPAGSQTKRRARG